METAPHQPTQTTTPPVAPANSPLSVPSKSKISSKLPLIILSILFIVSAACAGFLLFETNRLNDELAAYAGAGPEDSGDAPSTPDQLYFDLPAINARIPVTQAIVDNIEYRYESYEYDVFGKSDCYVFTTKTCPEENRPDTELDALDGSILSVNRQSVEGLRLALDAYGGENVNGMANFSMMDGLIISGNYYYTAQSTPGISWNCGGGLEQIVSDFAEAVKKIEVY